MSSWDSLYTKTYEENKGVLTAAQETVNAKAETDKQNERQYAEDSIKGVTKTADEEYNALFKEFNKSDTVNAVQKILNQRYIERKMAEWGLSNSGVKNRRLEKAEHLSLKSSAENREIFDKGKTEIADWKQGQIDKIEKVRDGNIAIYDENAAAQNKQLEDNFKLLVNAETNRKYAETVEQEKKALEEDNKSHDNWRTDYSSLISKITSADTSEQEKKDAIYDFCNTEGFDSVEQANAVLKVAGLDKDYKFNENGELQRIQQSTPAKKEYYTTKDGERRYHFVVEKATWNFDGGVDNDDVITIYYGVEGNDKTRSDRVVKQSIRIDQLPDIMVTDPVDKKRKSLKQAITDRTAWKNKGYSFYFTTDLGNLKI